MLVITFLIGETILAYD